MLLHYFEEFSAHFLFVLCCTYKIRQALKYSNTKGMEIQTNIYLYSFAFFLSNAKCLTNYLTLDTNLASYE